MVDAYEPPFTLQEYTQSLTTSPPEGDRIRLVAEWARIQGAGDFFVLLEEALNEAAHAVWAEFRPDAPPFAPARGGALRTRLMDSFNASVVSLLYSHETVPDSVLQEATVEYATTQVNGMSRRTRSRWRRRCAPRVSGSSLSYGAREASSASFFGLPVTGLLRRH